MRCKPDKISGLILALIVGVFFCAPVQVWGGTQVINIQLAGSENDAEEDSGGTVTLTEATLDLGGWNHIVGLRFTNVAVPKNAAITNAYIEFTTDGQDSGSTSFTIEGIASDNAAGFTDSSFDLSSKPVFSTPVEWDVNFDWLTLDAVHQGPNISAIIQKLVDRDGWVSGNAMAFKISGIEEIYRRAKSYDQTSDSAPTLHIEYTANVFEARVSSSTDDAYETFLGMPTIDLYDDDLTITYGKIVGLRFNGITIPQGSVINYAHIEFVSSGNNADVGKIKIRGHAHDNAPTFTTSYHNIYNRHLTTATSEYLFWSSIPAWTAGEHYISADISNIVQEIIGRAGWLSGNSLAITMERINGSRLAESFDGDPELAPLLHIEYGSVPGGDGGGDTPVAVMTIGEQDLGRSCWEGDTADTHYFTLMNSGALALNYTVSISYNVGENWLNLSPGATSGTLDPGTSQPFTVLFNSADLEPGTYEATITIDDPAAANNPQIVQVSLVVLAESISNDCGDIPLYTQNVASPAVLVLLDTSGSMLWDVDIVDENTEFPQTPDIKSVVQDLVNRDGWQSGNAMVFIIQHLLGSGVRYPRAYDGFSRSASLLHIEYDDGTGPQSLELRVNKSSDDGDGISAIPFSTSNKSLKMAQYGNGYGVGLRFENITIPKDAAITNAYIQFVPGRTDSDPIQVKIYGQASDNPATFMTGVIELLTRTRTATYVEWDIPPWTGITIESKIDVAKSVIGELVKDTSISWGFGSWCNETPWNNLQTEVPKTYTLIHEGCKPHTEEHQLRLQAAIDAMVTHSSTPFSPSILGAKNYFEGLKKDDSPESEIVEDGVFFEGAACQPKVVIEVTDGMGNLDSTLENVIERTGLLIDVGVSPVGIGFGVAQGESTQLYAMAQVANDRGNAQSDDYLFALNPLDEDGNASPYFALSKDDLISAFRQITGSVKGAVFHGAAPAATTSTDLGDVVIVASFDAATWSGDVSAIGKQTVYNEAKGIYEEVWNTVEWAADDNIPETRDIWTVNPSTGSVVAYTTDTLANDNYLCKNIGDIINSTPVVVGSPPFFHQFSNYKSFVIDKVITNPRDSLIYVGSNDGMLHVFNLASGVEEWAFLPKGLQDKLNHATENDTSDMCSVNYCHQYMLDGSPMVADVYVNVDNQMQWRTMLVIGQRGGGSTYTALDVTSGQSLDPSNDDPARYLWEYSHASLGETWSDPSIVRVRDATGDVNTDTAWGMYFGSGYATDEDDQATQEARLYALNAYSGTPLWNNGSTAIDNIKLTSKTGTLRVINNVDGAFVAGEVVTGAASGAYGTILSVTTIVDETRDLFLKNIEGNFQVGEDISGNDGHNAQVGGLLQVSANSQTNDALASPLVVNLGEPAEDDASVGTKFERIYAGNLYGTMFRVENIGKGQTPAVAKLFEFAPYPSSSEKHPIRAKAAFAYGKKKTDGSGLRNLWIYYGTGKYETAADKLNLEIQYFFGLKDEGAEYGLSDLTATTFDAEFLTASVDGVDRVFRYLEGSNANNASWAVKLHSKDTGGSERVLAQASVVDEIVFFTTFIPDVDICTGSGDAYLFVVDYNSGLAPSHPVFDINADGKIDENDKIDDGNGNKITPVGVYIGRGTPSRPVVFKDTIFVTLSAPASNGNNGLFHTKWGPRKAPRVESWKQH